MNIINPIDKMMTVKERLKVLSLSNEARWKSIRKLLKIHRVIDPKKCDKFCTDDQTAAQVQIWKITGELCRNCLNGKPCTSHE